MKTRNFTLIQYWYLIHRPYSGFINCPTSVPYSKQKTEYLMIQGLVRDHTLCLVVMSLSPFTAE